MRVCLSVERRPATVRMRRDGVLSGIVGVRSRSRDPANVTNSGDIDVQCFPLNSIMAALDVTHVDYLSLDVEGPELEIPRSTSQETGWEERLRD